MKILKKLKKIIKSIKRELLLMSMFPELLYVIVKAEITQTGITDDILSPNAIERIELISKLDKEIKK